MSAEPIDVVVVGAGISGLAVARALQHRDASIAVLEARSRVGGRLQSIDGLDLGATWFWPNEPRIQALVAELGVPTHHQYLDGDAMYHDRSRSQQLDGNPLDVPADRFTDGADSLARAIARDLAPDVIRLTTTVTSIARAETTPDIRIETDRGSFDAEHVVIALPPALAVAGIEFDPPLADDLIALARATPVWMGGITKVVVRYPDAFWRRQGRSGSAMSHVGPMRELHDMSGPDGVPAAIFGFVSATRPGEATVTAQQIVAQMVEIFGEDASKPDDVLIRDWRAEQHTSPSDVEFLNRYELFGHSTYQRPALGGRLHWASTETSINYPGHIEGALEAAERAVQAILSGATPAERKRPT